MQNIFGLIIALTLPVGLLSYALPFLFPVFVFMLIVDFFYLFNQQAID